MGGGTIQILSPRAEVRRVERPLAPPVGQLEGKVVAILNNRWTSMDLMAERFAQVLKEKYRVAEVIQRDIPIATRAPAALIDEVVAKSDLAIVGLAN